MAKLLPMVQVTSRFYAELNDFLSLERRMTAFSHAIFLPACVKDVIESLGVPHTEVGLIVINSEPVEFTVVRDGDRISVYPNFTGPRCVISPATASAIAGHPLRRGHSSWPASDLLRMLGFDALYEIGCDDRELSRISPRESRILLTRDRGLLKRGEVTCGYFARATEPRRQLLEVLRRFNLSRAAAPFRRYLRCNVLLQPATRIQGIGP